MTVFLTKVLQTLVYPTSLVLLLMAAGIVALVVGRRRMALLFLLPALAALWTFSTPLVARTLVADIESDYRPIPVDEYSHADVALLLGGVVSPAYPPRVAPDFSAAVDRVFLAARLYKAGRVDRILVLGGTPPWEPDAPPESRILRDLLVELGVPPGAVLVEGSSLNTRQNGLGAVALMAETGARTALLVTSGTHMRRALSTFRAVGIDVRPAVSEIAVPDVEKLTVLDLLPSASALSASTFAIKEYLGLVAYRLRGWA